MNTWDWSLRRFARGLLAGALLAAPSFLYPQEALEQRVLLIGDAGAPNEDGEPTLVRLEERASEAPTKTLIVFLGDNIYERGLADQDADPEGWSEGVHRISLQMDVVESSGASGWFLPGNHDWDHDGEDGEHAVARQQAFVEQRLPRSFVPNGACPGPVKRDTVHLRVIAFDSQWWLHEKSKPLGVCFPEVTVTTEAEAKAEFLRRLESLVADRGERRLLLVAHHPLDSHGTHGGYFNWQDHLFPLTRWKSWAWVPLPLVGSAYPLGRRYLIKSNQDLFGPRYTELVEALQSILSEDSAGSYIHAGGHEHSLQVLTGSASDDRILVSGFGSSMKAMPVNEEENTLFLHRSAGFMELDSLEDGVAVLRVYDGADGSVLYEETLP